MNAIVTGAGGFVGKWLVKDLIENGYDVTVIVRDKSFIINHPEFQKCKIINKDLCDVILSDFNNNIHYDIFFNLAWGGVAPEQKNNFDLQIKNIEMSIQMMNLCHDLGCELFVSTGTVAEYALTTDIMDLNSKQSPNDMYGAAKVATHYFLSVKARQINQNFIWCVLPSTYGEGRKTNNILTYTITSLLKKEKPLYGNLTQMWDFLYVSEVARAIRLIGEKGIPGKVYGIGSGEYRQLKDYILSIRNMIDPDLPLGIGEIPDLSIRSFSSCVNIYDLIKDTGFKPMISFEEGISNTIEYYRNSI